MLDDITLMQYAMQLPAMVLLNRNIAQISYRALWVDNRGGARQSVEYLIQKGHKNSLCDK